MRDYLKKTGSFLFGFSKGEAGAFTVLMPLLGLVLYSEPIWNYFNPSPSPIIEVEILDSLMEVRRPAHEFAFDPNKISAAGLDSLGFDRKLAGSIIRYRSAGGKFRKPTDLLKIRGMDTAEFERLEPWVRITGIGTDFHKIKPAGQRSGQIRKEPGTFDLNLADTADFEAWPGIGYKTAARIIRYRSALGGFIHREQLYEVWAIDSLAVFSMDEFHVAHGFQPKQININTATEEELEKHPYLSRQQARAILFYRFQHGDFRSLNELRNIRQLDGSVIQKCLPYLKVN